MSRSVWLTRAGLALVVVGAVGVVATPAQAASAGVVSVYDGTKVRYKAGGGHQNRVLLSRSGNTITVDDRVAVKAGAGCKAVKGDKTKVRCTTKTAPTRVRVSTYDRNDTIVNNTGLSMTAFGGIGSDKITGGPRGDILYADLGGDQIWGLGGNDRIYGSSQNDKLYGGDGADTIDDGHGRDLVRGGNGDDTLDGHGGNDVYYGDAGNDRISMLEYTDVADTDRIFGGAGSDTVLYLSYSVAVNMDADAVADDGRKGEGDNIATDVENLVGGDGNDRIVGNAGANMLEGLSGNDVIYGLGGDDVFYGGPGADKMYGGAGDDWLTGDDWTNNRTADLLDGGANGSSGDFCLRWTNDRTVGCEYVTAGS
ncbi:calcium-binding protein [Actinoplanes flavus]|uniref:Calcium-binding protein n=1 Tax=Actinoplanes flavus TaxID=2820290 RepID=A0ABS3URJ7_9ACTN|nr:calcium-binding protein [Actinoplanes flavus]MBO3740926.1 calcium-binding protein [Actinoplanes flavus]